MENKNYSKIPEVYLKKDTEKLFNKNQLTDSPDGWEDFFDQSEKALAEKEPKPRLKQIMIKGSVAIALKLGADLKKAHNLEIFMVTEDYQEEGLSKNAGSIEDIKGDLDNEQYRRLENFVKKYGLEGMPIHLILASDDFVNETSLFNDEPGVLLWSQYDESFRGGSLKGREVVT